MQAFILQNLSAAANDQTILINAGGQ
jgi:hypothetical protein